MGSGFSRALKLGVVAGVLAASSGMAQAACGQDTTIAPTSEYSLTFRICDSSFIGTVTARGAGWVAVGFSRDQYMPDTDVFMAGVLPDGTPYSQDAFAFFRAPPVADPSQDVSLLSASEANGVTTHTFSRLLNTGDTRDVDLTDGSYFILSAFNAFTDDLTSRHTYADSSDFAYQFAPVPEAQTVTMLLAGLGVLALRLRRRGKHPLAQ